MSRASAAPAGSAAATPAIRSLRRRETQLRELMDEPDCDPVTLQRTYARFALVNAVVSGQRTVYRRWLRPRLSPHRLTRLLDVGTGGADFPRRVLRWAQRDGLRLEAVAIDPDPRSIAFARSLPPMPCLRLLQCTSAELAEQGERFELVVSNHVLHHLRPEELQRLLADSELLVAAGGVAVHGDIERSRRAYAAFAAMTWPFQGSLLRDTFIRADGLVSIRRSRTRGELAAALPPGWRALRAFPCRVEAVWQPR